MAKKVMQFMYNVSIDFFAVYLYNDYMELSFQNFRKGDFGNEENDKVRAA